VGPQFAQLGPLMWILTLPLVINLSVLPLFTINVAFNKVRIPGIVTFIMGIGNIILAISLPLLLGWGYYGVAVAGAIVLTLKNTFFTPWYATKIMNISPSTFNKSMIAGLIASLIIIAAAFLCGKILTISSLIIIVIAGVAISLLYLIPLWYIGLNQSERNLIARYIPKYF
jgi:membrane protein EpsK